MSVDELLKLVDEYRKTPDSFAHELRLSLGQIIIGRLHELGWTQKVLAAKIGVTEPLISRFLNGDHNWTSKSAGRLLCALGVRARVQQEFLYEDQQEFSPRLYKADNGEIDAIRFEEQTSGQKITIQSQETASC